MAAPPAAAGVAGGGGGGGGAAAAAAALGLGASGPPSYAVRCVGWCSDAAFGQLHNLLKGVCVRHSRHDENEYGMTGPLASNSKQGSFRMIKTVTGGSPLIPLGPSQPVIWRVLHESPPLRGATYTPLPACVVEVSESCLYGIYCVQMFYALGCTCTHRITRKNCTYVCVQGGLELTVSVFSVHKRSNDGSHRTEPLFPGHAVEVRVLVPQGQQVEAAKKVGEFCQKLLPHVLMKKG